MGGQMTRLNQDKVVMRIIIKMLVIFHITVLTL